MESELDALAGAAAELSAAFVSRPELSERAGRLSERLRGGQFSIAVLGEFKKGKSTLVNALVGQDVMPMGALPLTSVVTELSYGEPGARVVGLDGNVDRIALEDLADYVTEARNPGNQRRVARVEATVPAPLLRPGVVLVDTPGAGSIFEHDEVAARALLDADGAVIVLSADAPLSALEQALVSALTERQAPTFYVLNRSDHLSPSELSEVSQFVRSTVLDVLGREPQLWPISARAALTAQLSGKEPGPEAGEFNTFVAELGLFIERDLVTARLATGRKELGRLADELNEVLALESAAAQLDVSVLSTKAEQLRAAVVSHREGFDDEVTLLRRDVAKLVGDIGGALEELVTTRPALLDHRLVEVVRKEPLRTMEDRLREVVQQAVRESFDAFRKAQADSAEGAWAELAERFRGRTEQRANAVRSLASDLFDVELPDLVVPRVAEERERYFYFFLHVGSTTESVERLARRLLPPGVARRRYLARARRELAEELDKHAGRARWDLAQRLEAVCRRFERAMEEELTTAIGAILDAAEQASKLREMAEADLAERRRQDQVAKEAAAMTLALVGPSGPQPLSGP